MCKNVTPAAGAGGGGAVLSSGIGHPWIAHTHPPGWNSSALKRGYLVAQGHQGQKGECGCRVGSIRTQKTLQHRLKVPALPCRVFQTCLAGRHSPLWVDSLSAGAGNCSWAKDLADNRACLEEAGSCVKT